MRSTSYYQIKPPTPYSQLVRHLRTRLLTTRAKRLPRGSAACSSLRQCTNHVTTARASQPNPCKARRPNAARYCASSIAPVAFRPSQTSFICSLPACSYLNSLLLHFIEIYFCSRIYYYLTVIHFTQDSACFLCPPTAAVFNPIQI